MNQHENGPDTGVESGKSDSTDISEDFMNVLVNNRGY